MDALLSPSALQTLAQSVLDGRRRELEWERGRGRGAADVRRFLARVREELDAVAARPALSRRWRRAAAAKRRD